MRNGSSRPLSIERLEDRQLLALTPGVNLSTGTQLTTYTLALATTAELTQAAGGKAAARALLNELLNEVNKTYESELAVSFQLHPQNDRLIFENPATDGYTNGSVATLINENPIVINTALNGSPTNESGYDFGHVIGLGNDGGLAGIGAKARGATDLLAANASRSSIKSFAHELGHHLNASHTFNGLGRECGPHRNPLTSVEPGSGSSLMGYQGICDNDNLPELPGDGQFLHAISFDEMVSYISGPLSSIGTKTSTGNSIPTVNAGVDRTIPAATPFTLTANASDPDVNDRLTYTWEQIDAGPTGASVPISNSQDATGPLFRSYAPTSDPSRTFPRIQDLASNLPFNQNKHEHLPTQNRELNFRVTVRDNRAFNGRNVSGVKSDDVKLTVVNTGAPFRVTTLNSGNPTVTGGSQQTITWDIAGTTSNGINTTSVDILLSVDGGLTYPLKLASQTNNDGSETVAIPNVSVAKARIKVQAEATQNVFFDINDADFQVVQNASAIGGMIVTPSAGATHIAEGLFSQTGLPATDTFTVALTQPSASEIDVTVTADSQTQVSIDGVHFAASQVITFAAGDSSPKTVTVKALDDQVIEGVHTGRVRQGITRSSDPNYSPQILLNTVVPAIVSTISDDESPPLIGAELDFEDPVATVPINWTGIEDPFGVNVDNLIRENGEPTTVDLDISIANTAEGAGWSSRTMDPSTIPFHTPDIQLINDSMFWVNTSITAAWSGLRPQTKYRVYVFVASEADVDFEAPIKQTITITGNGGDNPAPFLQDGTGKITGSGAAKQLQLLINGSVGNSKTPLEQYGLIITSKTDGTISIRVDPTAGGHAVLSALAIQEFLEPVPGITVTETNGTTEVTESGSTDTFSVVLDAQPTSNVVLNVSSADTGEATVDRQSLTFTPQNWNSAQTVMVTGINDAEEDGSQTVNVVVSVNTALSAAAYGNVPNEIISVVNRDNDIIPPWQNPGVRFDVSGDGSVVPLDALRIINELNEPKFRNAQGLLPTQRPSEASFYDVNGDGFATTNDALQVINFLNDSGNPEGELEVDPSRRLNAWGALAGIVAEQRMRTASSTDDELESTLDELAADRFISFA